MADISTGLSALKMGDYETAENLLAKAAKANRRDPAILVNLGIARQGLGDIDMAARNMSDALAMAPTEITIARPFQALVSRFQIDDPSHLNSFGLKAALAFDQFDRQPLVELAFAHAMSAPDLREALIACRAGHCDQAAQKLLGKRTAKGLQNDVLLEALRLGKNTDPDFERLFIALRRHILLHIPPSRMEEDHAFFALVLALIAQCIANEYVWFADREEMDAIAPIKIDFEALAQGDLAASRALAAVLLYQPFTQTELVTLSADAIGKIRPKALAALLGPLINERREEAELASSIQHYGDISDDISIKVANQYEKSPYPRWTSLHISRPGTLRTALGRFFTAECLAFMDQPFDVLIAGCGTGQQALRAASGYGDKASMLAIDLSKASLAYARRMAQHYDLPTVDFAQADILDVAQIGRSFDIIESVGVLHHMADPFKGWQALVDQLKPGGLMYIGLYSAISRGEIKSLRETDKDWPGAGCCDQDARRYRADIMARNEDARARSLIASQDFYSLSEFRDLILHENEHHMSIEQIRDFLKTSGLIFRGFTLAPPVIDHFLSHYPDDTFPGSLENWAELETTHRSLFDGMYLFWCEKAR